MTSESGPPSPDAFSYAAFDRVELRGADASAFAHAQFASDVRGLADGAWQWSACLTPQGRTIALMLLVRHAPDAIDLLLPARRGAELSARMRRFVFRSKLAIRILPDAAWGVVDEGAAPSEVAIAGTLVEGRLVLAPGAGVQASLSGPAAASPGPVVPDARAEHSWRCYLVRSAVPLLAGAAVEAFTPHALGLDGLAAISTRKGCYPGQEIVARTHFLGRNKRHLYRYAASGDQMPEPGSMLGSGAGENAVASVVLSVRVGDGIEGLLVGHERLEDATLLLGGAEVRLVVAR